MAPPRFTPGPALSGLRPLAIAAVVVLVVTLVCTLIQRPVPAVTEGATSVQPIGSSVLLCPEPGAGPDLGVRVTAAVVPGQPGQDVPDAAGAPPSRAGLETLPGPGVRVLPDQRAGRTGADRGLRYPAARHSRVRREQPGSRPRGRPVGSQSGRQRSRHGEHRVRARGFGVLVRRRRRDRRAPDPHRAHQPRRHCGDRRCPHPRTQRSDRRAGRPRPGDQGSGPTGRAARRAGPGRHGYCRAGAGPNGSRRRVRRRRAARGPVDGRHRLGAAGGPARDTRVRPGHRQR